MVGGLPLAPGAIPAGDSGLHGGSATSIGISADGRYVAFASRLDAMSAIDDDDTTQIYRKDRVTGDVVLVSRADGADGAPLAGTAQDPVMSHDGTRVAFRTKARLLPADTDDFVDVYVRDIDDGTTVLATPGTPGDIFAHDLAGNGRYVAFSSFTNLAAPGIDTNGLPDVYRRDLQEGTYQLASTATNAQAAGGVTGRPSVSADGRWVAYASNATTIVGAYLAGLDSGGDVFLRDMNGATSWLVSRRYQWGEHQGANGTSRGPDVVTVGADVYVAFQSAATDLAAPGVDTSAAQSIYRRRMADDFSVLVSRADGPGGANADARTEAPALSGDARHVAFQGTANNLGAPATAGFASYIRDVQAGRTQLVSTGDTYDVEPVLAHSANVVAWTGRGLIHPDLPVITQSVFARIFAAPGAAGPVELLGRPQGAPALRLAAVAASNESAARRTISADGRYVLVTGFAEGLPGSETRGAQVYRRDTLTGEYVLVSRAPGGAPGNADSDGASISADGDRVVFRSFASNLEGGADGSVPHAFVRQISAGTTTLVSRAPGLGGAPASGGVESYIPPAISADGGTVAFVSDSSNLGQSPGLAHIYARRIASGEQVLVDRDSGVAGVVADADADNGHGISGNGDRIVFASRAKNLVAPNPSEHWRIYVRDIVAGTTILVSRRNGTTGEPADESSYDPAISSNGSVVAFSTRDDDVATEAGPFGGSEQVIVRDLATHQNRVASRAPGGGAVGDFPSYYPSLSADGAVVAFQSNATNLLPGRGGNVRGSVFVRSLATGDLSGPPAFGRDNNEPQNRAEFPSVSENGSCVQFTASGHTAAGLGSDDSTAYVFVVSGECTSRLTPDAVPPAPAPVTPAPAAPLARPSLTRVSLLNPVFRVGTRVQVRTAAQRRRGVFPTGTRFRFRLSADAAVRIVLQQRLPGRRVGKLCRPVTKANRGRRACVRFVPRMTITRATMRAGNRSVAFTGRQGRKRLAPGRYRAVHRAVNAGGASAPVIRAFRVVPRR
jgi:Tol biopolymer transport system component